MAAMRLHRPFCSQHCKQSAVFRVAAMSRSASVKVLAAKPPLMVNSCIGKMGRAVAEAAVRAGLPLVPYTLCGAKEAAADESVEVAGEKLQLIGPDTRDAVIEQVRHANSIPAAEMTCGLYVCCEPQLHPAQPARAVTCLRAVCSCPTGSFFVVSSLLKASHGAWCLLPMV